MLKKTGRRPVGTTPCGEMGIALWRKHSAGHQHFWRPVDMVPNHAVAGIEALIQVHRFDQLSGTAMPSVTSLSVSVPMTVQSRAGSCRLS